MLSAIGIIIVIKQIPNPIGYDADYEGDLSFLQADGENTFSELIKMIDSVTPGAIVICLLAMAIMFVWEIDRIKKNQIVETLPGPLVAVIAEIIYQLTTSAYFPGLSISESHLVNVPVASDIADFFGQFTLPDFSYVRQVGYVGYRIDYCNSCQRRDIAVG